jgi:hypothetical protein
MAGALGICASVAVAQAAPSTASRGYIAAAVTPAPVTHVVTRSDIQYADDESQPQRDGWFWLPYHQKGAGGELQIVRDLSPEAHGDGSLHLVARADGDEVALQRLTATPGSPRLPLSQVVSGGFDVRVSSGAAPSFVMEVNCKESTSYPYGDVRLTYSGPVPAGTGWQTVDVVQGGAPVWTRAGSSAPTTLAAVAQECPIGTIVNYGPWLTSPGDTYVDNVSLNTVTSDFALPVLERVGGSDRQQTACLMAERQYSRVEPVGDPDYTDPWRPRRQAETLVLAGDVSFPDALTAAALAARLDAPLLLNHGRGLDSGCANFITSGVTAYVVGGEGVVSRAAVGELAKQGATVVRLGGADRFETAVAVAKELDRRSPDGTAQTLFVASGTDFSDALSAGSPAGARDGAVLLSAGDRMVRATADYLASRTDARVYAVGGPAAAAVNLPPADEVVGSTRYETATLVADRFFPEATSAAFASGVRFPDALSAAAYGGNQALPVLLVGPDGVPDAVAAWTRKHRDTVRGALLLGGTGAVDRHVQDSLRSQLTPPA